MTRARSFPDDNAGLCEGCNRPETKHAAQVAASLFLGGGIGYGTLWLCADCMKARDEQPSERPVADPPPIPMPLTDRAGETKG